ncbi:MAG: hypothetical protein AAF126_09250 [Chloroflexota bacterium]
MIRFLTTFTLIIMALISTGCAETGTALTLEANHAAAGTQVADIRLTATVQSARARTTLDFISTRSSLAATQSVFLEETLVATGFVPEALATQREQVLGSTPTPPPSSTPRLEATVDPNAPTRDPSIPTSTMTLQPITPLSQNPTATVIPTFDPNGLRVGTILTATGTGDDGCGSGITSTFSTATPEIFVIVPAFNLSPTDTFSAHWEFDGQPVGPVYTYEPATALDELCVWFFVDPTDFPFTAGSYTVDIKVNDVSVAGAVPFIIQQ